MKPSKEQLDDLRKSIAIDLECAPGTPVRDRAELVASLIEQSKRAPTLGRNVGSTYTYALLEVSAAAYEEISGKLEAAGYDQAFHESADGVVIDMHGIALSRLPESEKPPPTPSVGKGQNYDGTR